ncbi:MAG: hypothetical protein IH991_10475, partial [Planctomycetes bacterium]|nr:hypothetical protein [Planctomycetota bacterium]
MRYLSPCILVGCLLVSGCGTLPPYEPDQSLRGITAPPPIARNLDERPIGRTNFPGEAQGRDDSYKQLFDHQITLEEPDFNDSEDVQEFLERIPEKLRPLVVRELVQKALRDKRDARQREASKRDNRRSKALNPNRVSEHSPAWTDPDPKQRFSRMRRQGRERDFNQGNYYEDVALDSPERSERQERQQYGDEWEIEVAQAIKTLEQLLSDKGIDEEERSRGETCLRLLQVIAGDTESAVSPIPKLNSTQQDFWKHLVHALSVLLDQRNNPLHDQRAALALPGLRKAVDQLANCSKKPPGNGGSKLWERAKRFVELKKQLQWDSEDALTLLNE